MKNFVYLNNLYDYYESLLTENQKKYFEEYYFDNLSMQEIADNYKVSKNAVSKQIKITEQKLIDYEKKLKLYEKKVIINKLINSLDEELIKKINEVI